MGAWEWPNASFTSERVEERGMISVIDALNMDCILAHALTLIPVGVLGSASHFARSIHAHYQQSSLRWVR